LIPTKRLLLLVALGIPLAALFGQLGQADLFFWGYNLLLLATAVTTYYLAPSGKSLRLSRKMDAVLSVRAANRIELRLRNDGLERLEGQIRDEPPPLFKASRKEFDLSLGPGAEKEISYILTPNERGADYFRGAYVRLKCPLGLVWRQQKVPAAQPVRVYPNILALREFDLLKQRGRLNEVGIRKSRARGLGMEFESLRDYGEGDDYRKVDWKASARRGKLVVREYEQEKNQTVIVIVDVGRHMMAEVNGVRKLDRALDACLMLLHAAALEGDLVGLMVYSDRVSRYIPPRKGRAQIGVILNAIHDLIAEPVESDPVKAMAFLATRYKRRSLLVIFSDLDGPDGASAFAAGLGPVSRRHLAVVARVADPKLLTSYDQTITDSVALFERTAADFLIADRRKASSVLTAAGLHSLEADPDQLAAALVNFYFVVKDKALL